MRQHTCPICGTMFTDGAEPRRPTFPFCSARCRLVDLGNWLDGAYRVPAEEDEVFSDAVDPPADERGGPAQ
jgi:hypothetical protein